MANWLNNLMSTATRKAKTSTSQHSIWDDYDEEYIRYCIELEQKVSALEAYLHTSDDPKEIAMETLKTACEFYGGDWAGILEVDLDVNLWTPVWWRHTGLKDRTLERMHEFEAAEFMPSWIACMETNSPVIIPDVSAVKSKSPKEYEVYQRLHIRSAIGAPFAPNPMGFLAIRNPTRYVNRASMATILAYVLHRAMAQQKTIDSAKLALSPEAIQSDKDIIINFFGDMEIITSKGVFRERDFNSPKSSRVISYLILNRKSAHPPLEINSALWPDDYSDPEVVGRNIRGCIYRFRHAFQYICDYPLIESTPTGYRLNPDLNIMTDLDQFDRLWEMAAQAVSLSSKIDLLKKAASLYHGPVFQGAQDEHWIIAKVNHYRLRYVGVINELLEALAAVGDYTCVHHYAAASVNLMPGNLRAYYWLIVSICHIGTAELAKDELAQAKQVLTSEEYDTLVTSLKKKQGTMFQQLIE